MTPDLTETLCTRCGLCCDGSLFADVELAGKTEATGLEAMGLTIDDEDAEGPGTLLLPCAALEGRRCGIYPHRPNCCRTFECRVLKDAKRGVMSISESLAAIEDTLHRVRRLRELATELGGDQGQLSLREQCLEVLETIEEEGATPTQLQKRGRLQSELDDMQRLVQTRFLGV